MTKLKILGAVAILSAATIATPVLAQDEPGGRSLTPHRATHHFRHHHWNGLAHFSKSRYRSSMASSSRPGGEPISRKPAN
jgi:hypothetical protein